MDKRPDNKRSKIATLLMALVVTLQLFLPAGIADAGEITSRALMDCINTIRAENGIANPLVFNEKLHSAASLKLEDMKKFGYWRHENPVTGEKPWDFVEKADYIYEFTGENLALGFTDGDSICNAWKSSPEHLKNIVSPDFSEAGVAIDKATLKEQGRGILVVMMFGSGDRHAPSESDDARSSIRPEQAKNIIDVSAELKNTMVFVIIFFYVLTFIVLLFNYVAKRKRKWSKVLGRALLILALSSIVLTLLLFLIKS
jgi:hypothetical protein